MGTHKKPQAGQWENKNISVNKKIPDVYERLMLPYMAEDTITRKWMRF